MDISKQFKWGHPPLNPPLWETISFASSEDNFITKQNRTWPFSTGAVDSGMVCNDPVDSCIDSCNEWLLSQQKLGGLLIEQEKNVVENCCQNFFERKNFQKWSKYTPNDTNKVSIFKLDK